MKKTFLFYLTVVFLFSCNKDQLNPQQKEIQKDFSYEILTKESIVELISNDKLNDDAIDPKTKDPISKKALIYNNSKRLLTPCDDLDVKVFRTADVDGCCRYNLKIYHENYASEPEKIDFSLFIDGAFSGTVGNVYGVSFRVTVCDGPKLVEIYSEGVLCFSEVLTCDDEGCCSQLDYNFTSVQDDECCILTFTIDDPTECWAGGMAFEFNPDEGPPDTFIWMDNGVIVHLCGPEQTIRFIVWDDFGLCYVSSWHVNNDCKI